MPIRPNATARTPRSWRRLLSAALLALQVAIGFSPLIERPVSGPLVTHAHDQQRRHQGLHDESTCAICAARMQVAEAAGSQAERLVDAATHAAAPAFRSAAPAVAPRGAHKSRAPPVLG